MVGMRDAHKRPARGKAPLRSCISCCAGEQGYKTPALGDATGDGVTPLAKPKRLNLALGAGDLR